MIHKYKAYDKINNCIYDYNYLILHGIYLAPSGVGFVSVREDTFLDRMDNLIPLMFTNYCDKDDIEIYEGDIIEWIDYDAYPEPELLRTTVSFSSNYDTIGFSFGKLRKIGGEKLWCELIPFCIEVIGNKYTNPDLLN
jgi:hypothetical protein